MIRNALLKNKSLTQVRLGNNIFTADEAYFLASLLMKAKNDLTHLDMEDMCVNKDFLQLKRNITKAGKLITHGRVLSNYKIRGPDVNKLLFQRCKYLAFKPKKKKFKKDFGHFVLSLPDNPVTKEEFQKQLKRKKVKKIDKDLLDELMTRFSAAKGGKVDCVAIKEAYKKLYPDTILPEEIKKKKKGKKKGKKKKQT